MSNYLSKFKTSILSAPRALVTISPEWERELILGARRFDWEGNPKERDMEDLFELLRVYGPALRNAYGSHLLKTEEARDNKIISLTEAVYKAVDLFDQETHLRLDEVLKSVLLDVLDLERTNENEFGISAREERLYWQILRHVQETRDKAGIKPDLWKEVMAAAELAPEFSMSKKTFLLIHDSGKISHFSENVDPETGESTVEENARQLRNEEYEKERLMAIAIVHALLDWLEVSEVPLLDEDGEPVLDDEGHAIMVPVPDYDPDHRMIVEAHNGFYGFEMVTGELERRYNTALKQVESGKLLSKHNKFGYLSLGKGNHKGISFRMEHVHLIMEEARGVSYPAGQIGKKYGVAMHKMRVRAGIPVEAMSTEPVVRTGEETPEQNLAIELLAG